MLQGVAEEDYNEPGEEGGVYTLIFRLRLIISNFVQGSTVKFVIPVTLLVFLQPFLVLFALHEAGKCSY